MSFWDSWSSCFFSSRLLLFQVIEAGPEDLHGQFPVAVLGALVLGGDHDVRGQVGEAHRRAGLVDVLAAGAAGPEGVDAQVLFLDVDFDAVVHLGQHLDRGKGGVAAAAGVEGGDAHQAVDAAIRSSDSRRRKGPMTVKVTLLTPASSPGSRSMVSVLKPWRSA